MKITYGFIASRIRDSIIVLLYQIRVEPDLDAVQLSRARFNL